MTDNKSIPQAAQMLQLITGYWVSRMIHLMAKLNIADYLRDGAKSCDALSESVGVNSVFLYRVMRALASCGVFEEQLDGKFALTAMGATLRSDVPDSMRGFALMMIENYNWDSWRELGWAVETGGVALEKALGMPVFDYLSAHPEDNKIFGDSMTSLSRTENPAVAAAYDFSALTKVADIGGGHGSLIATVLMHNSHLTGVLFDAPKVIENARKDRYLSDPAVKDRIEVVTGDFFEQIPVSCDGYMMKYIMHDWNDELACRILKNIRAQIPAHGKLLVVDTVIPPGNKPHWGKLLDINMMVATGGLERTELQFTTLFKSAGFRLSRVIPTACPLSIIEGVPD